MDPKGPSQPSLNQVYVTEGNPATQTDAETTQASRISRSNAAHQDEASVEKREPHDQSAAEPTPSSMGFGTRSGTAGDRTDNVAPSDPLDGEQMRAAGEGDVMRAQMNKTGTGGEQKSLTSDLDRKKEEQAAKREQVKEMRQTGVDVDGGAGPAAVTGR